MSVRRQQGLKQLQDGVVDAGFLAGPGTGHIEHAYGIVLEPGADQFRGPFQRLMVAVNTEAGFPMTLRQPFGEK